MTMVILEATTVVATVAPSETLGSRPSVLQTMASNRGQASGTVQKTCRI